MNAPVQYTFAPMEGITGKLYRNLHHRYFGGADRYYAPFLSPTQNRQFSNRELRDIAPEGNRGIPLVPQILTKNPEDFLWCAGELAAMGYGEVNLNCGCPSGTVTAKGKGAGMLTDPERLDGFLSEIFSRCPLPISIKTRLGMREPEEFWAILECFNRYPVKELILHPRVRVDYYREPVRREWFDRVLPAAKMPLGYNGDLTTAEQCRTFVGEHPAASSVMVGRGMLSDPALLRKVKGGPGADRDTLRAFYEELYETYCQAFRSGKTALRPMKELWLCQITLFEGEEKSRLEKKLKKCQEPEDYRQTVSRIFEVLQLREQP